MEEESACKDAGGVASARGACVIRRDAELLFRLESVPVEKTILWYQVLWHGEQSFGALVVLVAVLVAVPVAVLVF